MKRYTTCFVFFLIIGLPAFAQQSLKDIRKKSWQTHVYRITADTAAKYIQQTIADPDHYLSRQPVLIAPADSLDTDALPTGNYLAISVKDNELVAEVFCRSNLQAFAINNQRQVQLEIKDTDGNYLENAAVWINGKPVKYDTATRSYWVKGKKPDEALVKVALPGDTLFMSLWAMDEIYQTGWSQWWQHFSYSKVGSVLGWPVRSVKKMITRPPRYWFSKRRRNHLNAGYMVFNKPEYFPLDSVKFKAYIVNRKTGKPYNKALDVFLQYYDGGLKTTKLITLKPETAGAFLYEFALGDSVDSDRTYNIVFKDKKSNTVLQRSFSIEDYVLDEVVAYSLESQKKMYFRNDTLVFLANAKDANGLALMDGRVNLYVLVKNIGEIYRNREFVPDTLWKAEKPLLVNEDTRFEVPALEFPAASMTVEAVAVFRNSNNELQEQKKIVEFSGRSLLIDAEQEQGMIKAVFKENGKPVNRKGWLKRSNQAYEIPVDFPYSSKIDTYTQWYEFSIKDSSGNIIAARMVEPGDYEPGFNRIQQKDTAGFSLYNPARIPIHYTVLFGSRVIATGGDSTEWISWKKVLPVRKGYHVRWQYVWKGDEGRGDNTIASLDKLLATKITGASTVYPGQTDTITVEVRDYKGRPANNVNITAVSYNSQFGEAANVPEPSYIKTYRMPAGIKRDNYEAGETGFTRKFILGKHPQWISKLGLDTMVYYNFLFPKDSMYAALTLTNEFFPQVAVHIVKQGVPQGIYMLYINRRLVYYNGVTDKSVYAFSEIPGNTQIAIRLHDQYIEIDSVYLQPFYKHDLAFDLDHLPVRARVSKMPEHYTSTERNLIEGSVWQLQNDSRTNFGYAWQNEKLVYLGSATQHLVGPFNRNDSIQFFKPGDFDLRFPFESGYQYRLTPQMARLERTKLFPAIKEVRLPAKNRYSLVIGDTIIAPPVITYANPAPQAYLEPTVSRLLPGLSKGKGNLRIEMPKDSSFQYAVLYRTDSSSPPLVKNYSLNLFNGLKAGTYTLILITSSFNYLVEAGLGISDNGTYCVYPDTSRYSDTNSYISALLESYKKEEAVLKEPPVVNTILQPRSVVPQGNAVIWGKVLDKKGGAAIPYAIVFIKGTTTSVRSGPDGSFRIEGISNGRYVLVITAVGYESEETSVLAGGILSSSVQAQLTMSNMSLNDVVVIGYGTQKRKSVTGSVSSVRGEELTGVLMGSVPGVSIRGINSFAANTKPLYVINGVLVEELPADFEPGKAQINVMRGAVAESIYGARAANGVIVITTTDFIPKELRDKFRDYAFWQPQLLTDENGLARFTVTYPDNITGWWTFVVGMDRKKRITRATSFVKSFKPLLAQLSAPQFLVEGDSVAFIGKTINYTDAAVALNTHFSTNDDAGSNGSIQLAGNASGVEELFVVAGAADTLAARYTLTTTSGYRDGEMRKIPVVKKGTIETIGNFWILDRDTTVSFTPARNAGTITLHAQNNTLDLLLEEIGHLKKYPYFCMEQVASKLTGLVMERKIRLALKQPFRDEKELQRLLGRLQKGQLFEGGWSWWEGGQANVAITNYVTRALVALRSDALVETNIRNALLYLQSRLPFLRREELPAVLFTLSEAGHEMDYGPYMRKLHFDSLPVHQQWQVISIKQKQKVDFGPELRKILAKSGATMLGGLYWGENSYQWESNRMASTVIAFNVLQAEGRFDAELKRIIRFFLEQRKDGRWMNTVESASIVSAVLPFILKNNARFTDPAVLKISTGAAAITEFPFTGKLVTAAASGLNDGINLVTITKSGGGLVYFTAYQQVFNKDPLPVTGNFRVSTTFRSAGNTIAELKAGEKVIMNIELNVSADAEYVQMEIPVPAGCTYGSKKQEGRGIHREYLKDKAVFFIEHIEKGTHSFEIELEPRYTGMFTLNPAKAELMYFPVFFGRNETKKLSIKK